MTSLCFWIRINIEVRAEVEMKRVGAFISSNIAWMQDLQRRPKSVWLPWVDAYLLRRRAFLAAAKLPSRGVRPPGGSALSCDTVGNGRNGGAIGLGYNNDGSRADGDVLA